MNPWNVCNNIGINSYFSFSLWLQISSISSFRLKLFCFKKIKEVQLKCEMCDLYTYAEILIDTDMLAFCFLLKCISSMFK